MGCVVCHFIIKLAVVFAVTVGLAGCSSKKIMRSVDFEKEEKPDTEVMAPMQYSWNTNYSAMLTPPLEIREKALAACKQRGFDRALMKSISLNENLATANFSCRGSDY